jgi:hypothetical protein
MFTNHKRLTRKVLYKKYTVIVFSICECVSCGGFCKLETAYLGHGGHGVFCINEI